MNATVAIQRAGLSKLCPTCVTFIRFLPGTSANMVRQCSFTRKLGTASFTCCRIPFSLQIQSKGRPDTTYQISSETPKDSSSATVIGRPQALIIQLIKYTSRRMSS